MSFFQRQKTAELVRAVVDEETRYEATLACARLDALMAKAIRLQDYNRLCCLEVVVPPALFDGLPATRGVASSLRCAKRH